MWGGCLGLGCRRRPGHAPQRAATAGCRVAALGWCGLRWAGPGRLSRLFAALGSMR